MSFCFLGRSPTAPRNSLESHLPDLSRGRKDYGIELKSLGSSRSKTSSHSDSLHIPASRQPLPPNLGVRKNGKVISLSVIRLIISKPLSGSNLVLLNLNLFVFVSHTGRERSPEEIASCPDSLPSYKTEDPAGLQSTTRGRPSTKPKTT